MYIMGLKCATVYRVSFHLLTVERAGETYRDIWRWSIYLTTGFQS